VFLIFTISSIDDIEKIDSGKSSIHEFDHINKMASGTCFAHDTSVTYQGKMYRVLTMITEFSGQSIEFPLIIDDEDYERIKGTNWHRVNQYIGHNLMSQGRVIVNYLHQTIMNHTFDGKTYVDHINRIPHDNRKENLRLVSQTQQNWNQKKRKRTVRLPDGCGINPDEIPTNIEYHPTNASENEYFEVSIKVNGQRVCRKKTSKSQRFTLIQKLNEAKIILRNLMIEHPEWFENRCMNGQLTEEGNQLYESYFEILKLAHMTDPFNHYLPYDERNKDPLNIGDETKASTKRVVNMPPKETGIIHLPKNCRYVSSSETRGDYFEYEKQNTTYRSSTSKTISTNDKYIEFIQLLENKKIIEWNTPHTIPWGFLQLKNEVIVVDPVQSSESYEEMKLIMTIIPNAKLGKWSANGDYDEKHHLVSVHLHHIEQMSYITDNKIKDIKACSGHVESPSGQIQLSMLKDFEPDSWYYALSSHWVNGTDQDCLIVNVRDYILNAVPDRVYDVSYTSYKNEVFSISILFDTDTS